MGYMGWGIIASPLTCKNISWGVGPLVTRRQKSVTMTLTPNNKYPNSVRTSDKSWFTIITIPSRGVSINGGGLSVYPEYFGICIISLLESF